MRKWILILGILANFNAYTYEGTISKSGRCGRTDEACHYDLYDDGHLEISGSGRMNIYDGNSNMSPWGTEIETVAIHGVKNIGTYAFVYSNALKDIQISNTVETISCGAFEGTGFNGTLVIPESVQSIDTYAFANFGNAKIVIEGTPRLFDTSFVFTNRTTIYCPNGLECTEKGVWYGVNRSGQITSYDKQDDLYVLIDDFGVKSYYASIDMMTNNVSCSKDECQAILNTPAGQEIAFKGKFYNSVADIASGNYLKKRIYTIDEANQVAGKVNSVKIRYR